MKHASPLGNSQLSYTLKEIKERALLNGNSYGFNQYADQFQKASPFIPVSKHLVNYVTRDEKSLISYDMYQNEWYINLDLIEKKRNRLNIRGLTKNYKACKQHSEKHGDFFLQDRVDEAQEYKRNTDLFKAVLDEQVSLQAFSKDVRKGSMSYACVPTTLASPNQEFGQEWLRLRNPKNRQIKEHEIEERSNYIVKNRPSHITTKSMDFKQPHY